jgi:hypothetical protein
LELFMMDKKCSSHSGIEVKIDVFEKTLPSIQQDLKHINAKLNRYGGALMALASIPLIIKLIEILTPVAHAIIMK